MTVVAIRGGLGNQIWQLAAGWLNAKASNTPLVLDFSLHACYGRGRSKFWLDHYRLDSLDPVSITCWAAPSSVTLFAGPWRRIKRALGSSPTATRLSHFMSFEEGTLPQLAAATPLRLDGYFQDSAVLEAATLAGFPTAIYPMEIGPRIADLSSKLWDGITVHVRRDDLPYELHVSNDWYVNQVESLRDTIGSDIPVTVFSDDPCLVSGSYGALSGMGEFHVLNSENLTPPELLYMMSCNRAFIGSRGTFSFWAGRFSVVNGSALVVLPAEPGRA